MNIVRQHRALANPRWLPRGLWPELDALADEHDRLAGELVAAEAALRELRRQHEAEDREATAAHAAAIRSGGGLPAPPDPEARRAALDAAGRHRDAAEAALEGFCSEALAAIREAEADWDADLAGRIADAQEAAAEARRAAEAAELRTAEVERSRRWLTRTVTGRLGHLAHDDVDVPPLPGSPAEINMARAMSGLPPLGADLSPADGRESNPDKEMIDAW